MNLRALTYPDLIFINPPLSTPDALIERMSASLAVRNLIGDKEAFIRCVLQRESEGPTALGEELAVPHGKSPVVQRAAFCLALFDDPILWPGLEGDEDVRMVFLLAIPEAEAGSTHMQLLTTLTSSLTDERVRNRLLAARTCEEALSALYAEAHTATDDKPARSLLLPTILGAIAAAAFLHAGLRWLLGLG